MNPPYCSLKCFPKGSSLKCAWHLPLLKLCDLYKSFGTTFSKTDYYVLEISVCMLDN